MEDIIKKLKTGFKDRNGVDIREGDILSGFDEYGYECVGEVEWDELCSQWIFAKSIFPVKSQAMVEHWANISKIKSSNK